MKKLNIIGKKVFSKKATKRQDLEVNAMNCKHNIENCYTCENRKVFDLKKSGITHNCKMVKLKMDHQQMALELLSCPKLNGREAGLINSVLKWNDKSKWSQKQLDAISLIFNKYHR